MVDIVNEPPMPVSKWKTVRPWHPPSTDNPSLSHEYVEEPHEHESDITGTVAVDCRQDALGLDPNITLNKRRQLEVIDVSSTSVSLAVYENDNTAGNSPTSTSCGRAAHMSNEYTLSPPAINVKLNSHPWPHFFHSDSPLTDLDGPHLDEGSGNPSSSSVLVWGLSPGVDYQIELAVQDEPDDDNDSNDVEDLSDLGEFDQMEPSEPSARASEQEPDVPPPPYSSHDPSLDAHAPCDAEASLRNLLEQLRVNCKQHETTLLSSIAALRKTNDKLTREDQRLRQRIHMLEDSTLRLREVASEEASESLLLEEAISELEEAEKSLQSRLEHRREELEKQERNLKEECDRSDTEANLLNDRLEKASAREEEVLGRKLKLERELLPTYNIQLATLEADLRRMLDDYQRRQYFLSHSGSAPATYSGYTSPSSSSGSAFHGLPSRSSSLRQQSRQAPYADSSTPSVKAAIAPDTDVTLTRPRSTSTATPSNEASQPPHARAHALEDDSPALNPLLSSFVTARDKTYEAWGDGAEDGTHFHKVNSRSGSSSVSTWAARVSGSGASTSQR